MYERFFGLSDAPFRLTPDPRYLFLSRRHADALAHLRLGLEESGFVCLTGDVGTGKTTLLRAFLAQLGPEIAAAYVFNPALSPLELLRTLNAEFGLRATSASPKKLIDGLNAHLLAQREARRRSASRCSSSSGCSRTSRPLPRSCCASSWSASRSSGRSCSIPSWCSSTSASRCAGTSDRSGAPRPRPTSAIGSRSRATARRAASSRAARSP